MSATPATELRSSRPPRERLASVKDRTIRGRNIQRHRPPKATHCPECNSTDIIEHDSHTVCGECGVSINESNIVSEVTFGESSSGAAVVQGAFVGQDQRHARGTDAFGARNRGFNAREPREISEAHGRDELKKQASWHHLPEHIVDRAFAIYKLALNSGFNQGRQLSMVAAVCLYAACRRDKESQMLLIDFAEGIAVNVFRIGQTWQELKKKLFLTDVNMRPVMEVEDLVARFMKKLEFGRDMKKVANDALLILRRMKRDWMVTGRRPNGLIGACIILAARMNNYRRTVREVVYVVKVADVTVAKRLEEFKRTPSAAMTVEDFKQKGMRLKQGVPPAIYEREQRENKKRKLEEILRGGSVDENNAAMQSTTGSLAASGAGSAVGSPSREISLLDRPLRRDADGFAIPHVPKTTVRDVSKSQSPVPASTPDPGSVRSTPEAEGSETEDGDPTLKRKRGRPRTKTQKGPVLAPVFSEEDLITDQQLEEEMEIILSDTRVFLNADEDIVTVDEAGEERAAQIADALRRGATAFHDLVPARPPVSNEREVREEEFEDDPEVANCLLSEDEQKIKERIWVTHNEDWLRAQQAKMLKKALDEAHGTNQKKKERKKRRKGRMGDGSLLEGTPVESAGEAARLMLEKHAQNPSRHINYANVDKLYADFGDGGSSKASSTRAGSLALDDFTGVEEQDTGLPTPAGTQGTPQSSVSGHVTAKEPEKIPELEIGDGNDDEVDGHEDVVEEPKDQSVWDSEESSEEDEDYVRTSRSAGVDMGSSDIEEDENAGFSETEQNDNYD